MTSPYSRQSPSPRYQELLAMYRQLHVEGEKTHGTPPEKTFSGKSLGLQSYRIRKLIQTVGARSLLDYGCGKAVLYQTKPLRADGGQEFPSMAHYLGIPEERITLYDPAYAPYSALPQGTFDAVICTDVLEHCPEQDILWILHELFAYATKFVFANIACYPAKKNLPNGENAHCTIRPFAWWARQIAQAAAAKPELGYHFWIAQLAPDGKGGTLVEELSVSSDPQAAGTGRRFAV